MNFSLLIFGGGIGKGLYYSIWIEWGVENFLNHFRLIRLSSPNLNYLIGAGAIVLYVDVCFYVVPTVDQVAATVFCNVRIFTAINTSALVYKIWVPDVNLLFIIVLLCSSHHGWPQLGTLCAMEQLLQRCFGFSTFFGTLPQRSE